MAKKLLSETIDFCFGLCAAPKIHTLTFKGEGGDLCRLRSLEKRDELWGILGSPYTRSSWAFVPLPLSFLAPFPFYYSSLRPFPFLLKPLRPCSP